MDFKDLKKGDIVVMEVHDLNLSTKRDYMILIVDETHQYGLSTIACINLGGNFVYKTGVGFYPASCDFRKPTANEVMELMTALKLNGFTYNRNSKILTEYQCQKLEF